MRRFSLIAVTAVCAALAAPPAAAFDRLVFDAAPLVACLAAGGGRDCIGAAADPCMEATEGGFSTFGMVGCLSAEVDWWDGDLNATYRRLRELERAGDAEWDANPMGLLPRPSGADGLRDMQRAWIAFRDTTCSYEALDWWGGTGASLIGVTCHLQMTAEQALRLRGYLAHRLTDD